MSELRQLVSEELSRRVDARVAAIAAAIAEKHVPASRAVLFYGSCLRGSAFEESMLDFYLIVSDYRTAYEKRWLAAANQMIPPNVFYFESAGLVAKYAVLSEADFAHECSLDAWTVSTAARFAQPSRLVWAADRNAAERTIEIVSGAAPTLLSWTLAATGPAPVLDLWTAAFTNTFAAELRAERLSRSNGLVESEAQRYKQVGEAALRQMSTERPSNLEGGRRWWRRKRRKGKLYSVARLAKASFTFAGGAEYIAWKINRHAGTTIRLKPWQRRHPLLAGITLLPRLLKSGAVR